MIQKSERGMRRARLLDAAEGSFIPPSAARMDTWCRHKVAFRSSPVVTRRRVSSGRESKLGLFMSHIIGRPAKTDRLVTSMKVSIPVHWVSLRFIRAHCCGRHTVTSTTAETLPNETTCRAYEGIPRLGQSALPESRSPRLPVTWTVPLPRNTLRE